MRIRKNAKLSSILGLSSTSQHVCQLNQSPWDVIPFSSSSHDPFLPDPATTTTTTTSLSFPLPLQLDGDDSLTGNASFGDSLGAVDSGVEMVVDDEDYDAVRSWKQADDNDNDDNEDDAYSYRDSNTGEMTTRGVGITRGCSKRTNGKGRRCSREAKGGHYQCEQHSKPHRSPGIANSQSESPTSATRKARRGRPPKRGPHAKPSGGNNSNQFYYYSGFGPSWGRRRAERGGSNNAGGGREESRMETEGESSGRSSGTPPPLGRISGEEYAAVYDYEDEDEDEDSSGGGRKRTRKPVKARSLKSLM